MQLNKPEVQTVVLQALLEDPNVQDLIHDRNLVGHTATSVGYPGETLLQE